MFHTHFVKSGFEFDVFALTALVDMYAKLGMLVFAHQVFDEIAVRDIPTWNALIAGYTRSSRNLLLNTIFGMFSLQNLRGRD